MVFHPSCNNAPSDFEGRALFEIVINEKFQAQNHLDIRVSLSHIHSTYE
jgi:hypothetical protein